jgi:hypothetical protein
MDDKIKNLNSRESIVNYEVANHGTIVFVQCKNKDSQPTGYWDVIENSALIMFHIMQPKIGRKTKINAVLNYYCDRAVLRVAYHKNHIEGIWRKLLDTKEVKLIHQTETLRVFKLKKSVPKEQFKQWYKDEEVKVAKRDALLLEPAIYNPEMSQLVRKLGDEIVLVNEKIWVSLRDIYGTILVRFSLEMYLLLCEKEVDKAKFINALNQFGFLVSVLANKTAIDERRALRIGKIIKSLRKEINVENSTRKSNNSKR